MDVRNCLRCNKKFKSEGRHNRICARCNIKNERSYVKGEMYVPKKVLKEVIEEN